VFSVAVFLFFVFLDPEFGIGFILFDFGDGVMRVIVTTSWDGVT
jgi:hypothetical protein